ncbi:MAG: hypothetical protein HY909_07955 [Deltaproteobacteria bacterium]|nr:hypothetical protein [Deltaproteobacteria bacterium]
MSYTASMVPVLSPVGLWSLVEALVLPLDRARTALLGAFSRVVRPFVRSRSLRVTVAASAMVLTALLGASWFPLWMLLLGPLVWGVPHILSDLRYLVLRPGLHRRPWLWVALGAPLAWAAAGGGAGAGLLATVGALSVARGDRARRAAAAAVALGLAALAFRVGRVADVVFAHAHHFVTVALWWRWRAREDRWQAVPLGLFALATVGVLALGVPGFTGAFAGAEPTDGALRATLAGLCPGVPEALAVRLLVLFAFAQAVHYGVWLRLVPEDDRPRDTPRTFRQSARALVSDCGPWVVAGAAMLALGVGAYALMDATAARVAYGRVSFFHGYLELAAAALLWAEDQRTATQRAFG